MKEKKPKAKESNRQKAKLSAWAVAYLTDTIFKLLRYSHDSLPQSCWKKTVKSQGKLLAAGAATELGKWKITQWKALCKGKHPFPHDADNDNVSRQLMQSHSQEPWHNFRQLTVTISRYSCAPIAAIIHSYRGVSIAKPQIQDERGDAEEEGEGEVAGVSYLTQVTLLVLIYCWQLKGSLKWQREREGEG